MRVLAELTCEVCHRSFFGDLPAGHGLTYPMLLERESGEVHDALHVPWFAAWLKDSYANRNSRDVALTIEHRHPVKHPVLLNCLDTLYGHCVLKLLNAQLYLDQVPALDVIVLIPPFLRWMVPDGVAEIWTADLPLSEGTQWSDALAGAIRRAVQQYPTCMLSLAFSHPHPGDFSIERFTRVKPFDLDQWQSTVDRPVVTYVWRQDRMWRVPSYLDRASAHARLKAVGTHASRVIQMRAVSMLADGLRDSFPGLDFALVGLGPPIGCPHGITDLRAQKLSAAAERAWCERYGRSHVVVGIHGSNMLLPSAHAGSTVDLMPRDRWGNFGQDILFRNMDERESALLHRFLPSSTDPTTVCEVITSLLSEYPALHASMRRQVIDHRLPNPRSDWRDASLRERSHLQTRSEE